MVCNRLHTTSIPYVLPSPFRIQLMLLFPFSYIPFLFRFHHTLLPTILLGCGEPIMTKKDKAEDDPNEKTRWLVKLKQRGYM